MRPDQYEPLPWIFWKWLLAIGLFIVVVALLLPAIQQARVTGGGPTCKNNLKQIGLAFHSYYDDNAFLPAQVSEEPGYSWRVSLLRYVDQVPLDSEYDRTQAWNTTANWPLAREWVPAYACPQSSIPQTRGEPYYASYAMPVGEGTVFQGTRAPKFSDVTDGLSSTLFVVEACDQKIIWTEPRDVLLETSRLGVNRASGRPEDRPALISSNHPDGANVVFGDGAARFLSEKIDPETLRRLLLAQDGETVGKF